MSRTDLLTCGEHHEAFRNLKIIIYLESKQKRNLEKLFSIWYFSPDWLGSFVWRGRICHAAELLKDNFWWWRWWWGDGGGGPTGRHPSGWETNPIMYWSEMTISVMDISDISVLILAGFVAPWSELTGPSHLPSSLPAPAWDWYCGQYWHRSDAPLSPLSLSVSWVRR